MTLRLLVEGMLPLATDWQQMMLVMAVASLVVRQPGGDRAEQPEADAGVLDHLADGLRRCWAWLRAW